MVWVLGYFKRDKVNFWIEGYIVVWKLVVIFLVNGKILIKVNWVMGRIERCLFICEWS